MSDLDARNLFLVFYILFFVLRMTFHLLSGSRRTRASEAKEPGLVLWLRWLMIPYLAALVVWCIDPRRLAWAAVSMPTSLRVIGAVLSLFSLVFLIWVHLHLGRNFSGLLRIRDGHQFVQAGPYRWMRHPMYTGFLMHSLGSFLLTRSLLLGLVPLLGVALMMVLRTPLEEQMMRARFGTPYDEYCLKTGRYLPRINLH